MKSSDDRTFVAPRSSRNRSRISNGSDLLPGIDGRSAVARRYFDILTALLNDQGGADRLSEARLQLCRRFAAAALLAEIIEARVVNDETPIDLNEHALLASTLVRLASKIGVDRRARNVTPALADYLDSHAEPVE